MLEGGVAMSGEVQVNSCRNCGARINGCVSCGRQTIAGDGIRVGLSFTPEQVYRLALDATEPAVRERLICALGTVDRDMQRKLRAEMLSTDGGCPSCSQMAGQVAALELEREELIEQLDQLHATIDDEVICASCTNKYSDGLTPHG
jgi:hypothetical protein